jgi:Cu/Ag efflux protein CusF
MSHETGMQMDRGSMRGMGHGLTSGMQMDHSAMLGMNHGSMGGMQMDRGAIAGMSHGSTSGTQMDHSATPGMSHSSKGRMAANHDSMPGMSHGSTSSMQMDHGSMSGMSRSSRGGTQMAHSGHAHAQGSGTVNSVDAAAHKVNVSHGPISAIGLPAMTVDFAVAPSVDLQTVKPGTRVNFTLEHGEGGMYVIQSMKPAGGGR